RHVADALVGDVVGAVADQLPVAQPDRALGGHEAHDGLDRRRAPRAVAAEQAHDLALADVHVDAVQDVALAVVGLHALELQQRAHRAAPAGVERPTPASAAWASASTEPR